LAVYLICGIASLCLLWLFVLSSPYKVELSGRKVGPSEIDELIKRQYADRVLNALAQPPELKPYSDNTFADFSAKYADMLNNINSSLWMPLPSTGGESKVGKREYRLPFVDQVVEIEAEAIRTAAYIPIDIVTFEKPYEQVEAEIGDIDFITVEGKFDVAALYDEFRSCFVSRVKKDWKSNSLAEPVFAAVSLERRNLLNDGSWSQWQVVPRTRIDRLVEILDVPEIAEDKHAAEVLKLKIKNFEIQSEILQPLPYDLAGSNAEWLTPTLHKEFVVKVKEEEGIALRQEREKAREQAGRSTDTRRGSTGSRGRSRTSTNTRSSNTRTRGSRGGGGMDDGYGRVDTKELARLRKIEAMKKDQDKSPDALRKDLADLFIDEKTDLKGLREPLLIWAHDDTVEPGNSYQYRMRIGALNPIAGQDWVRESDADRKDNTILWGEYSKVTDTIEIDKRSYFFPQEVAAGEVNVQVSTFFNGLWRNEDFMVVAGEPIGKAMEVEREKQFSDSNYQSDDDFEIIDFGTGAILVDIARTSMWAGSNLLVRNEYSEILYTLDGDDILHMPIKKRNWPDMLQKKFNEIAMAADENYKIVSRGQNSVTRGKASRRSMPYDMPGGMDGMDMDDEDMMMMMMMMGEM
jgi:hypothetical protein